MSKLRGYAIYSSGYLNTVVVSRIANAITTGCYGLNCS